MFTIHMTIHLVLVSWATMPISFLSPLLAVLVMTCLLNNISHYTYAFAHF